MVREQWRHRHTHAMADTQTFSECRRSPSVSDSAFATTHHILWIGYEFIGLSLIRSEREFYTFHNWWVFSSTLFLFLLISYSSPSPSSSPSFIVFHSIQLNFFSILFIWYLKFNSLHKDFSFKILVLLQLISFFPIFLSYTPIYYENNLKKIFSFSLDIKTFATKMYCNFQYIKHYKYCFVCLVVYKSLLMSGQLWQQFHPSTYS